MAQSGARDDRGPMADPPWDVQVTIVHTSRGSAQRARFPAAFSGRRVLFGLAVVLAGVAAVLVAVIPRDHAGTSVSGASTARGITLAHVSGPPAIATAYRYPLGCLGASISTEDAGAGARRAHRSGPCWRYGVYVTAILTPGHRGWRMALEAISPACPHVSLPPSVRAQVVVCAHVRPRSGPRLGAISVK